MSWLDWILPVLAIILGLSAAGHATLWKRNPKAALGWVAFCLTLPFAGPILYFLFGINRIQTRAKILESESADVDVPPETTWSVSVDELPPEFSELARISQAVTGLPLVSGNRIEMLHNGEQVYPAMLEMIDGAEKTLYLTTYIFETNTTGRQFVDALARAAARGVEVRVIIDGVGEWYARPRAAQLLAERGVRVARFLEPKLLPPTIHFNLRNHRKILIADGWSGFTGGMNIGDRHLADREDPGRVVDVHFRIEGPIVGQLERVFIHDWAFSCNEVLSPSKIEAHPEGRAICRAAVDGPDDDLDKLITILIGAVSAARSRVAIMSPYFLPPRALIGALQAAALRGVEVVVVLPEKNNLPYVHWATRNMLWQLLERGVKVYYQPPPFVHSKLFAVDNHYVQIGSANLDPRSLRLNFELSVEVFDRTFASQVSDHFAAVLEKSRPVTKAEVDGRGFWTRLRDSLFWLFSPYL